MKICNEVTWNAFLNKKFSFTGQEDHALGITGEYTGYDLLSDHTIPTPVLLVVYGCFATNEPAQLVDSSDVPSLTVTPLE